MCRIAVTQMEEKNKDANENHLLTEVSVLSGPTTVQFQRSMQKRSLYKLGSLLSQAYY